VKLALKRAYRLLFNSDLTVSQGIARARVELPAVAEVETFLKFIEASQRGSWCDPAPGPPSAW